MHICVHRRGWVKVHLRGCVCLLCLLWWKDEGGGVWSRKARGRNSCYMYVFSKKIGRRHSLELFYAFFLLLQGWEVTIKPCFALTEAMIEAGDYNYRILCLLILFAC